MKANYMIAALTLAFSQVVHAGGTTGPCTPPSAEIQITPDQKCSGKNTVAIGKDVSLEATEMKDKDCHCGTAVNDSINTTAGGGGVEWTVGGGQYGGSFPNGADSSPATWTASSDPHTSLAVRLKLNDDGPNGSVANAQEDGPLQEVNIKNMDVVIPNKVTTATTSPTCAGSGTPFGAKDILTDTVARNGCTVDFSGLLIREHGCSAWNSNGCGFGTGVTGTPYWTLNSSNTAPNDDEHSLCTATDAKYTTSGGCSSDRDCQWVISGDGASTYHQMFTRNYVWSLPTGYSSSTVLSRSIVSYP